MNKVSIRFHWLTVLSHRLTQIYSSPESCSWSLPYQSPFWSFLCVVYTVMFYSTLFLFSFSFFSCAESDIYEDPSVRFESKKILQPDPTNMENYLVNDFCMRLYTPSVRLAYKSSSKSAKRCLVPCLEARSAIVRARASERELDLFPLLEIESSDVILARTFQGAKSSQGVN